MAIAEWLPKEALTTSRIEGLVRDVVAQWSAHWFAKPVTWSPAQQTTKAPSAKQAPKSPPAKLASVKAAQPLTQADHATHIMCDDGDALAQLLLQMSKDEGAQLRGNPVTTRVAKASLADLAARFHSAGSSSSGAAESHDAFRLVLEVKGAVTLTIGLARSAAVQMVKANMPKPAPATKTLSHRQQAIDLAAFDLEVAVAPTTVTVEELKGLEKGDVVLFPIAQNGPLIVRQSKNQSVLGMAELVQDDSADARLKWTKIAKS